MFMRTEKTLSITIKHSYQTINMEWWLRIFCIWNRNGMVSLLRLSFCAFTSCLCIWPKYNHNAIVPLSISLIFFCFDVHQAFWIHFFSDVIGMCRNNHKAHMKCVDRHQQYSVLKCICWKHNIKLLVLCTELRTFVLCVQCTVMLSHNSAQWTRSMDRNTFVKKEQVLNSCAESADSKRRIKKRKKDEQATTLLRFNFRLLLMEKIYSICRLNIKKDN